MGSNNVNLPPGFRFYPTDGELVVHFLHQKAALLPFHPDVILDLDLYPYDPWELDGKALAEGNKWYYFSRKTQNRISGSGFWKPLGVDEPVFCTSTGSKKVGMKKHFVFYKTTEATAEVKTNFGYIMQEFRLSDCGSTSTSGRSSKRKRKSKSIFQDYSTWVLCRIYERNCDDGDDSAELSCLDEVFLSLDDLDEISLPNN
ncbi:NAC domain-containing protein 104-like [Rhododendron vialii]|uniref:NAC domain-containing protein 104-like n=1 Tax=Rhododendron vialii TaxID=182163 RepID=UPI00265DF4AE|nr:NAC domain-containing protein 104-like [Rhododendron vialii]